MGKGDKKTKRGKIVIGSYGVRRAHKKKNVVTVVPNKKEVDPKPKKEVEEEVVVVPVKVSPKKTVKKSAEPITGEEKPKTPRARKKTASPETPETPEEPKEA